MTTLHQFTAHWLVYSLGWTLLHFCWQGAVVAALLWSVLQLLGSRSAQSRYLAACCALGLMAALPLATFTRIASVEYRLHMALHGAGIPVAPTLIAQVGMGDTSWLAQLAAALNPAVPWVLMAWLAGSALFLMRLSVGFSVTRKMRFIAVSAADPLQEIFAELTWRLRIARPVMLMNSALVQVPTVIGWLRPVVLIPVSCFTGLPQMQIEAILCHELAHIRRHDYLVSVLQSVVEALLFYHPAVWWVSQQIRRERECCCDDMAVAVGGDALAYARALTTLETRRSPYPQVMLGANGGILTMRIKRLLISENSSAASQLAAVAVLAMLIVSAITIASTARAEARVPIVVVPAVAPMTLKQPLVSAPVLEAKLPVTIVKSNLLAGARPRVVKAKPEIAEVAGDTGVALNPQVQSPAQAQSPETSGPRLKVASGIMSAQAISKATPIYPAEAKAARVQGAVVLRAVISKTGEIQQLQVVSGPPELMASALDAVRQWKFKPYLLNGEPTEVETTITVNYHMSDQASAPAAQNDVPDAAGIVPKQIGGSVSPPALIYAAQPDYSAEARAKKVTGTVLLHLWVDEQGKPTHIQVLRGLGNGLDQKAIEAVKLYKFKPAMEDGKPVVVSLNTEINFQVF